MQRGQVAIDGRPSEILVSSELLAAGAGTMDAATLARDAGFPTPWPLERDQLLREVTVQAAAKPSPLIRTARPASHETGLALKVGDLEFSYPTGRVVLDGVSFAVGPGEAVRSIWCERGGQVDATPTGDGA